MGMSVGIARGANSFVLTDDDYRFELRNIEDAMNQNDIREGTIGGQSDLGKWANNAFAPDHSFQQWWWYRLSDPFRPEKNDPREFAFSRQTGINVNGSSATVDYFQSGAMDVGLSISVQFRYALERLNANEAKLHTTWTIGNPAGRSVDVDLFAYLDPDVGGTAGADVATYVDNGLGLSKEIAIADGASRMKLTAVAGSNLAGGQAFVGWEMKDWSTTRAKLSDAGIYNLMNQATPYNGTDLTAAFQWRYLHLGPGMTASGSMTQHLTVPEPGTLGLLVVGVIQMSLGRLRRREVKSADQTEVLNRTSRSLR